MAQPATADSPLVVISYHLEDKQWVDRVLAHLRRAAAKPNVSLHHLPENRPLRKAIRTQLDLVKAKVVVLVVSPNYMGSPASEDELNYLSGLPKHVRGFVLVTQHTGSAEFSKLPSDFLTVNAVPLTEASIERQDEILSGLVKLVDSFLTEDSASPPPPEDNERQPTIADLAKFALSDEVDDALRRARKLATASTVRPSTVTTPALLFGLAEGGRVVINYFRSPQFLWKELTAGGEDVYTKALMEGFPGLISLGERASQSIESIPAQTDLVTANVVKVFAFAEEIAVRTIPQTSGKPGEGVVRFHEVHPRIGARHLLGALLALDPSDGSTGASRYLAWFARSTSEVAALRKRFYDFIVKNLPDDDHQAWRSILIDLKLPESRITPEQKVEPKISDTTPQPTVAGFIADDWNGRDLLGITRDVNALASLVAAYKVEPPLSIGLFGDWGSGKSHFMRQMKKRVEMLSRLARDSGQPQRDLGFYKNIVQIEVNAWHYIEGNLWASLVDHIFANLKLSEREPPKYAEERRNKLIEELDIKEELKKKIDSQVEECTQELRKVEARKQQAEADLNKASTQLENFRHQAEASLETLTVAVKLTDEEKELLKRLGLSSSDTVNGAEVRKHYDELKGRWNRFKVWWQLFRSDKRVGRRYLFSGLAVLFAVGGPLLLKIGTLPRVPTLLVTAIGFLATFIAAAKPAWDQFQKTLQALEKRDQEVERERLKRITELESKVNALGGEVVAAKLKSESVGKEIDQLKANIASTSSRRILAEFIEDRAAAADYRRHLGLLALVRRDFEKLRDLFEQQRAEEEAGTEGPDDQIKINRIVLYIDDLDRCPPERVVQVLQAIHLLLAFPLFVVVVGVDSRWITRSLAQSYEWLRETDELVSNDGDKHQENGSRLPSGATPHDYLEKIFQIPFWLRSMNEDACAEFLDGLTKDALHEPEPPPIIRETTEPVASEAVIEMVSSAALNEDEVNRENEPDELKTDIKAYPKPDPAPDRNVDLAPRSLTFSDSEIEYMKELVPLIGRSPRAVKRFLNCYRLIKVGLTPEEFDKFVGEQGESHGYKAVMILLGIITGAPTVSSYVIDELKKIPAETTPRAREQLLAALDKNAELQQQRDAQRLNNFLKTHDFGKPPGALFHELLNFVPRCSRFSFKASRADGAKL